MTPVSVTLPVALAVPVVGGFLSGFLSGGFRTPAYARLKKPSWQPPSWVFGPMWTTLYLLMGAASWLLWTATAAPASLRAASLGLYALQLALNLAWTPLFTAGHTKAALALLLVLDIVVLQLIVAAAYVRPLAAALLVPYFLWLALATALNGAIVKLN